MTDPDFDSPGVDRYREWDAAYVLGSLSPAERHEYEHHLAGCPECRAALAELAGMPGLLASIPRAEALELLDPAAPSSAAPAPVALRDPLLSSPLLPSPTRTRTRTRPRPRVLVAAAAFTAVAAAIAVTLALSFGRTPGLPPEPTPGATLASQLTFTAEVPSPLTAVATLDDEPWGTRIDWTCTYEKLGGSAYARDYAMVVTERSGASTRVATWTSGPGTTATPTATTSIHRADIASVSIVDGDSGAVLLRSDP
ncbi:anti-sigma factor family protein [Subtercola boreus]|uniref:Putative zinc-finger domain-containing protein n=1 Tax=Subtercola boreus TaxID=120213 RepID=A0A3E0W642_9MICO|nr:zf-HC2 domain-containing protein [Subtercola boreus]RFA17910.1 hypothetical protein B7R24_14670 [Subtercola boreus]RFA18292.1 hypothetical protein B7R23_14705 [Subtercola boreus]RFA24822.1 hypothetical protein B7R25_14700 [Subtercola boreus]